MRKKKLLNLSAIIIGALLCFGFNKVQAIDSVFDGTSITRNNLQSVATSNALSTPDTSTVLGISKTRKTGNYYSWENNTTVDAKNVWKIADYTSGSADYSDLYYCLNAERGFGATQGRMAEGATDTYITEYEVNDTNKSSIIGVAGGSLGTNYNKVLWILDNLYIPTGNTSYKTTSTYKNFKTKTGMEYDLTEEQIEVVQQMAIWYFTNNSYEDPNNNRGELPNLYYNGTQTSNITLTVDEYGERVTLYDALNSLYKYFITNADAYYNHKVPTLTISNTNATVEENGNYFVAGPFKLEGTNTSLIDTINATISPNKSYTLLNSNRTAVSNNDFSKVVGSNFYLRFAKSDITSDTAFNIKIDYTYDIRNLIVKTDITDVSNTQPVVLIEPGKRTKEIETNINIQLKGSYDLVLVKEDENGEDLNSTAKFEVNGQEKTVTGRLTVADDVQITSQNVGTQDVYTIKELVPPDNYCKFDGIITVRVTKSVSNGKYIASNVQYTVTGGNASDVNVYLKNGNIYVEVINHPFEEGKYDLVLVKEDENGEDLNSTATFELNGQTKTVTGRLTVADDIQITKQNVGIADIYTIKELVPPDEYCKFDGIITVTVTKKVENGKYVVDKVSYTVTNGNKDDVNVYLKDGNIYVEVKNYPEEKPVNPDLALRKFITNIGNKTYNREPSLGNWTLDNGTTITKTHSKDAIKVETGDIVTYTIRVYNEGNVKGKATKVTDYLPEGLELVENNNVNNTYGWTKGETKNGYTAISTEYFKNKEYIEACEEGNKPAYVDLQIVCKVTAEAGENEKNLKNIAEITTAAYEKGTTDRDSVPGNVNATNGYNPSNPTTGRGEQDDDDFELLVLEEKPVNPDLALRKFITNIGNKTYNREPSLGNWTLDNGTTITKTHSKDAIKVETGDIVTYTIRVYNEGNVKGKATKVTDYLPEGLELVENNNVNNTYGWTKGETKNGYTAISTEYFKNKEYIEACEEGNKPAYVDLQIVCKVTAEAGENEKNLKNIAEITTAAYEKGTTDRDSVPGNVNATNGYNPSNPTTGRGEQDDDDFELLVLDKVEDGELKIKLLKADESENTITSSEAKFEVKEGNKTETKTTTSGTVELGQKTITAENFEYIYTIKETQAPVGYELVNDELSIKINGTTKKQNNKYIIDTITIKDKNGNDLDNTKILANYDSSSNTVVIKIKDKKIENEYSLRILKVNKDGTQALENAWFKISTNNNMTNVQAKKISINGETITSGKISSTDSINLTYYLKETQAPVGYILDESVKEVKIKSDVELKNGKYELKNVRLEPSVTGIELVAENNVITIKVKNNPEVVTGKYKVKVQKVDSITGEVIDASKGAKFKINNKTYTLGESEIANEDITSSNDINLQYSIEETMAPTGYDKIEGTKTVKGTLKIVKDGTNWKVNRLENVETNNNITMVQDSNNSNTIIIKVKDNPTKKNFDLALRKFITAVNKEELKNADGTYTRAPKVDTSTIATTGTATYRHTKYPVSVQKGDVVTYTLRVYNEGELDGYVNKIADYLPNYLLPIIEGVEGIDSTKYAEEITFNADRLWALGNNNRVETEITNKEKQTAINMYGENGLLLTKFEEGKELDYIDVQIKCLVKNDKDLTAGKYLTNIAEIVDAEDINGEHWDGKDSTLNNVDVTDIDTYKDNEALASDTNSYIEGQEDDDDFEKLILESFDLSLRKFITRIGNTEYNRAPEVDTSKLGTKDESGKVITTATYNHPKDPLNVKKGDIITYTLRVYNEGTLQGYATEIFDYIPEGLEFIENTESSINQTYGWKLKDGKLVSTYLADKLIKGVKEENESKVLDYKDVQIQLKVTADPKEYAGEIITNWAEIGEDSNNDIDSTPGNEIKTEDDIDYEPVKLVYFDLALRKFITNANGIDYNNREPEVDTSKYGTLDENGKKITSFTYKHTKDPVIVTTGSTVIYTIRVYNEGSISGYATEITDNIPEGLQFLPEDKINTDYKWKMLDAEGNVTEDTTKAKKITTTYLANDIIDSYQKENGTELVSFKDVKVAFKVIEPNTSNRLVINTAEISKASDEDIDSTPGNNDLTEDDIDREYLKVKYFDLALKKWVTETRVTYNGKTTVKKTGFNENSTDMAKVDLVSSRLKKTTVKFAYNIKIINEGEVAGYATQVEDYIPAGLKFVQADNPKWKLIKDDVAVTDQLKDTLLEPGQSATIEIVLTWKNGTSNMGVKTNWAEIKEDSDDDVDSVPDNYKKEEDDIDNAKVILSIKTGSVRTYILLGLISITILAGGTFLIKKYVISE